MGGVPSLYMSIIQELAGQGVLVLAVEHADGSGAFTDAPSGPLPYQPLTKEERKDTQRQFERRNGQLQRRVAEVRLALDHVVEWVQRPASRGPSSGDIHRVLFNRVDLRRIAVAGHSFGGATALSAASHDPRFAAVVALDPWMFPLDVSSVCTDALRGVPVLTMFGDGFTKWKANAESAQALLLRSDKAAFSNANPELVKKHGESSASETADTGAGASAASTPKKDDGRSHRHTRIITLHGAQHQSFNDLPFFAEVRMAAGECVAVFVSDVHAWSPHPLLAVCVFQRVMRLMKEVGSLPQEKATRVITTSTLAFLHTVLRDIDSKRYFLGPQVGGPVPFLSFPFLSSPSLPVLCIYVKPFHAHAADVDVAARPGGWPHGRALHTVASRRTAASKIKPSPPFIRTPPAAPCTRRTAKTPLHFLFGTPAA